MKEARERMRDGYITQPAVTGFEDEGNGNKLSNVGGTEKPEKARKWTVPWSGCPDFSSLRCII